MVNPWDIQTIELTSAAACEAVGSVLRKTDWDGSSCADLTYEILRSLGFEVG